MSQHQIDRAVDEVDGAMRQLRRSIRTVPIRREGFKAHHDKMAQAVARLTVALSDARAGTGQ